MTGGLTVAIGGLGAIGAHLARAIDAGVEGLSLVAVAARDRTKAERTVASFRAPPAVVAPRELAERADIVVEAAPASVFAEIAEPAIARGRVFVPASVGALLPRMHLVARARETGARIVVPTGALLGLDAVRAAAEGEVESVSIETRKPPRGLAGAPYLEEHGIDLSAVAEATRVFVGNAFDAARGFPANVNVAAALALAGIGPERTRVEIWADPRCHAQHPHHPGGGGGGAAYHDHRERAERGEPAHRAHHAALHARLPARADEHAQGGVARAPASPPARDAACARGSCCSTSVAQ